MKTKKNHKEIRKEMKRLIIEHSIQFWKIAEILHHVYEADMYENWGYDSWKQCARLEIGWEQRKTQYAISLWEWYLEMPNHAQDWITTQSWSKMKVIYRHTNKKNWRRWKRTIEGKTLREIEQYVRDINTAAEKERSTRAILKRLQESCIDLDLPERIARLRSAGLSKDETAFECRIETGEVREMTRFISAFVPKSIYEEIKTSAKNNQISIEEEISSALCEIYNKFHIQMKSA